MVDGEYDFALIPTLTFKENRKVFLKEVNNFFNKTNLCFKDTRELQVTVLELNVN